jgi:CRP/FNR family transcriptional regulator
MNTEQKKEILQKSLLFSALSPQELHALASVTSVRLYESGALIFQCDAEADGFYIVAEGKVKIYRVGFDGREQILHIFGQGDICGEVAVFEGKTFPAFAEAITKVKMLYLARNTFLDLCRQWPEISLEMLGILSRRLRKFVNLIDDLSLKEVPARLAQYILDHKKADRVSEIKLPVSKTVLASHLGTIPATLSRSLRKMQDRELIEVDGNTIRILDLEALIDLAISGKLL